MLNLSRAKESINKITSHLSLGILGSVAAMAPQAVESQERQIEEVVVSATKKKENASDVPITVTALTEETLKEMNVSNFDEYIEYLPNVTSGGRGPGQSTIYIRGMAVDPVNVFLSAAQGSSPNVALYLDEQPIQVPGRNLDVYVADMERIEVLAGPQGTLFGASSQAGTVRLITNKPKFDVQEGGFNTSLFDTAGGSRSYAFDGFLNVPISESWAVRGVVYQTKSGGYIDNVEGTWSGKGRGSFNSTAEFQEDKNTALVEDDFNDSSYKGFRLSSAYSINEDWDLLVTHVDQDITADGVFDYDPAIGDLKVSRFIEDTLEDSFNQTSITLEGRMGSLDAIYTGSLLERTADQTVDYSGYANVGAYLPYYVCNAYDYTVCGSATVQVELYDENQRTTHEFRVSSNEFSDLPFSYTAGVFIDESELQTQNDYGYLGTLSAAANAGTYGGYIDNTPIPGAWAGNPNARPSQYRFFNDILRLEEQTSFFTEVTIPVSDKLDVLFGVRKYDLDLDFRGQSKFGYRGANVSNGRDYDAAPHGTAPLNLSDQITKFTLSYKPDADTLYYFTRSEGYRPGGFNRGGGKASSNPAFPDVPLTYATDDVINTEFGVKTLLLDGAMRLNASYYNIEWTDIQVSRFDPKNVSILTFVENAADADVSGLEADILWYPTDDITIASAMSYNSTEVTRIKAQIVEIAPVGSALPLSPDFQWNVRIRKDSELNGLPSYTQLAIKSASDSFSSLEKDKRYSQSAYRTVDFAYGFEVNNTEIEFFIRNLTDERAQLYYNDQDDIPRITTNRPRNMGVRASYKF
ncbi:TonB-dependent receptor plug domain-containing protein [Gammaproteobacteria bacterium]|jgi:iron complex outermembrane receptor protein|nr:TonB-dependent receptor plug domain-containing protein [Gammaproteobacteria bacterium]MDA9039918.1 TonB-dependent receptor plug domain-containing protein [Gammaproteobacteria bacterium]MDA9315031.1 TonB-dependent receptor plug domain-containing protein [Gammaproteobacteria bacterium]MDA9342987.1 TonB-dependent receptor plug domain-containing protein [Gammaproteobacteria bacterium]